MTLIQSSQLYFNLKIKLELLMFLFINIDA
jgi:hypothetical protein